MVKHGEKESEPVVVDQDESQDVAATVRRTLEEMLTEMKACGVASEKARKERKKRKSSRVRGNASDDEKLPVMAGCDEDSIREKEESIMELGQQLKKAGKAKDLAELIKAARPFFSQISKAKAAKLVRALVEMFLDMEAATGQEVELCKDCIEWAKEEKRNYLRQSLESRLMLLYHDLKDYTKALALGGRLLKELKRLDDKNLLVEVQLCESKVYHGLGNLGRARAALTSAKTTANGIYIPPKVQAALDMQSGILHAAEDRDFKTAFSYFYESFEGYSSVDDPRAIAALKYMLMSKIMLQEHDDVNSLVAGKVALRYAGKEVEAMKKIAKASRNRSLAEFQQALRKYRRQLEDDAIIRAHLDSLYDQMLEQNLMRIIEPYSKVQVDHVASSITMAKSTVEKKLSQMILDKSLLGVLDQGTGMLVVFEPSYQDRTYEEALETIHSMDKVVDVLFQSATKLTLPIRETINVMEIPASA